MTDIEQLVDVLSTVQVNGLTELEKFEGKSKFVGNQFAVYLTGLTNFENFVGKSRYIGEQLAYAADNLTDVDKFIGKSEYVSRQLTVQVYQSVDPQNPALLMLLIPFVGIVLIRIENERIKFYDIRRILSFGLFMILLTSSVFTPFSYSLIYWGQAFAEEPPQNLGPPNGTAADEFAKRVHVLLDGKIQFSMRFPEHRTNAKLSEAKGYLESLRDIEK